MTRAAASARAALALLILAALLSTAVGAARDGLLAQHLSYFTNQSNFLFVVLAVASLAPAARRIPWWDDARGAVAFYLAMTGIVYALLVAPLDELLRWDLGWTGIVLHRLAPLAALVDWVLTPRRRTPSAGRILWWQLYPVVFLVLTWGRGGFTAWYPYEFLDPTASSWGQVLLTTAVVLIAFVTVAAAVHLLEGRARPHEVPAAGGPGPAGASRPTVRA
ncbi:MAG TPA: Pr6Pr family membrane protein [Brachybacterium sp.]|nr:Pr6Pr family membrane protein [Brachybacterium sp.]